jgi:hypothetical protein
MIEVEKLSLKEITAVFLFAFSIGALLFGWFEWKQIPISYWPIGVDIYPRWVGSNAFWRGESPYSLEVDLETQSYLYGRPAEAYEDPMGFYIPCLRCHCLSANYASARSMVCTVMDRNYVGHHCFYHICDP